MNQTPKDTALRDCVLVVDDDALIADLWCLVLEDMGHEVCGSAATADDAIAMAEIYRPRLVLMDVRLRGEQDGVDAACAIHAAVGSTIIFITGSREASTSERIQQHHPAVVLIKPVSDRELRTAVTAAMQA